MEGVHLKFTDGALEAIAREALEAQVRRSGVAGHPGRTSCWT
jgi:ATP-dependent protease Clp ATPase subunit